MAANESNPKAMIGCVIIVATIPAAVIWYVLFGMMLHHYGAGAMEWSLYVGYLICSVLALCFSLIFRCMESTNGS